MNRIKTWKDKALSTSLTGAAFTVLGICTPTMAQEMPKEFEFVVTFTWATDSVETVSLGGKDRGSSTNATLVATNAAGGPFMHNMVADCTWFDLRIGETREQTGACEYEDKDGDQLHEIFRNRSGKRTIEFIGGTGKFTGIHCEGEFKSLGFARGGKGGVGQKIGRCEIR